MGKTSAAAKNRYNAKAYDRVSLSIPKGDKEKLQAHAGQRSESLNGFIQRAIRTQLRIDNMCSAGVLNEGSNYEGT